MANNRNQPMRNNEVLNLIAEELRYIRKRLDDHIDDEDKSYKVVERDISSIKQEMSSHRTKVKGMLTGATILILSFVTWLFGLIPK